MVSRHSVLRWSLVGSLALSVFVFAAMTASLRSYVGLGTAAMRTFEEPLPWLILCIPTGLFWAAVVSLRGRGASNVLYATLGAAAVSASIGAAIASSVGSPRSTDTAFAGIADVVHVALVSLGSGWITGVCCGAWLASSRLRTNFRPGQE